jgi:hypothetical protein
MKNTLYVIATLAFFTLPSIAEEEYLFACERPIVKQFLAERYFYASDNIYHLGIMADSKTIQIDRKKKIIKVWTTWIASKEGRKYKIDTLSATYENYGYSKTLLLLDYKNNRFKILSGDSFNCDGSIIEHSPPIDQWNGFAPDSTTDGIFMSIMEKYHLK